MPNGLAEPARGPLGLLHLAELELDRGRTTENEHRDAQAALFVVDFLDHAVEVVERTIGDADHLARLEEDLRTGLFDTLANAAQDGIGLAVADRVRTVGGAADEPHDLRGFLDQVPALVVDTRGLAARIGLDLDEDVTGEERALTATLLAAAHLDDFLGRNQDLTELLFHALALDALFEGLANLLLEPRIGVNHVPALAHALPQCPSFSSQSSTIDFNNQSMSPISSERITTTTRMIPVVFSVSSRDGQTTLRNSNCDSAIKPRSLRPGTGKAPIARAAATAAITPTTRAKDGTLGLSLK